MGHLTALVQCDLPFVKVYADRRGKMRYYFRRRGCKSVTLPGRPGSPEFLAAYQSAMDQPKPPVSAPGIVAGSFNALCREYLASAEFCDLAPTTRREMGYVIESLRKKHEAKPVKDLMRRHIMDWKDGLKTKPGAANKMLRTIKILMGYAVLKDYRKDNPADKIKLMKVGRIRAWTDAEMDLFELSYATGTMLRMIYDLALYGGQRRADLAKVKRTDVFGPDLHTAQQKTGKNMIVRIHANLAESMAAYLPTHEADTIIAGPTGTAISPVYMAALFRAACRAIGLPPDCKLHGLRKTTARSLAEIGEKSTPVTGHMTRAMQDEYERDANQQKMASASILNWEKNGRKKRA